MTIVAACWHVDQAPGTVEVCRSILDGYRSSDPDACDAAALGPCALGRALIRFLPEDATDRQPVSIDGGRSLLVADLRLDNREELAANLDIPAAEAAGMADATLLGRAWAAWGLGFVHRVVGAFAVVVWDAVRRRLHLVRDPCSERPLHFHKGLGRVVVASLPRFLRQVPGVPWAPDLERLAEFLALVPMCGPQSFHAGICRVEPGQIVTLDANGGVETRRWERWPDPGSLSLKGTGAYVEAVRDCFDEAVRCRLRRTGSVASHLSGGLDSGLVTATAARILGEHGDRLMAFTAAPDRPDLVPNTARRINDESPFAAALASIYGNVDHDIVPNLAGPLLASIEREQRVSDWPSFNPWNLVWLHAINDRARARGHRILMTGQFGNRTISQAGTDGLGGLVQRGRWGAWLALAVQAVRRGDLSASQVAYQTVSPFLAVGYRDRLVAWRSGRFASPRVWSLLSAVARKDHCIEEKIAARARAPLHRRRGARDDPHIRGAIQRIDLGYFNKGAQAEWRLDHRDPTRDIRLVKLCMTIPRHEFLAGGRTRSIAMAVAANRLPSRTLTERRHRVQAADAPIGHARERTALVAAAGRLARDPAVCTLIDMPRLMARFDQADVGASPAIRVEMLPLHRAIAVGLFIARFGGD